MVEKNFRVIRQKKVKQKIPENEFSPSVLGSQCPPVSKQLSRGQNRETCMWEWEERGRKTADRKCRLWTTEYEKYVKCFKLN